MTRAGRWLLLLMSLGSPAFGQEGPIEIDEATVPPAAVMIPRLPEQIPSLKFPVHPHREMRDKYFWGTFGPPGLMESALSAAVQQWRGVPHEWDQDRSGFVKRFSA